MAVQYIQNKNNTLGTLGTLGTIANAAGTLTGQGWLSALGSGMLAANKMINGNDDNDTHSAFQDALKGVMDSMSGWLNPAQGNIAKPGDYSQVLDYLRKNGGI